MNVGSTGVLLDVLIAHLLRRRCIEFAELTAWSADPMMQIFMYHNFPDNTRDELFIFSIEFKGHIS
jgi:hypothetical protein